MRTRIKICCISSPEEAALAVAAGADALGLVSAMPSGPGVISEAEIGQIVRRVPPPISTFLLTSERRAADISDQVERTGASTVQICDTVEAGTYEELRRRWPALRIVQVIHIVDESALDETRAVAPGVDALLLDSGRPQAAVPELGGTGRVHDWSLSRRVVEVAQLLEMAGKAAKVPVFLAGGLRPSNVQEAVRTVRPFGVDVCSGVRTDDRLDEAKLMALVAAVRSADLEASADS